MPVIEISDPADVRLEHYQNVKERDLTGRDGLFVAEGKVVLNVLLQSPYFEPVSILVLKNRMQGLTDLLQAAPDDIPVYVVSQHVLDTIAGFHLHRGVLALARKRAVPEITERPFGPDALVVVASAISNHDNIGAIFRNAASFDADKVLLDSQCCNPLYRKSIRVSVGAVLQLPFEMSGSLDSLIERLVAEGFHIAALSPSGKNSVTDLPNKGKRALILGSEGHGLPASVMEKLSTWSIPMSGKFDSLNVAAASAIALFHSSRFCRPD